MDQVAMSHDDTGEQELPLESVGQKLARKREAAGLSLAALSAQTRIPERHLAAIEAGDFAALPARTYAVGFSRSYAKAVGLDDKVIADGVRAELAAHEPDHVQRGLPGFEPGDPARVPGPRFAWAAGLGALAVLIGCFLLWRGYFAPAGELPSILPQETPAPAPRPVAPAPAALPSGGPVVFTAKQDKVWVKFYSADGTQLLQKELVLGESFTVPAAPADVRLDTARPEALSITIGGQPVPALADKQVTMRAVPVSAAALLARGAAPAATPAPVGAAPAPSPAVTRSPVQRAPVQRRSAPAVVPDAAAPFPAASVPAAAAPAPAPAAT